MPILTQPFSGSPGGMNVALSAQEIEDTQARYIQDALLDYPGLIRRRGPMRAVSGFVALPRKASGLVVTINPAGNDRYAVLTGTALDGFFTAYASDFASTLDITWPHSLPTDPVTDSSTAFRLTHSRPSSKGGTWVGTASDYSRSPNHALAMWKGGNQADYTTGTISVSRGSATVTGVGSSWAANVVPGMFLFANTDAPDSATDTLIGTVLAVNSNTQIILDNPSPYPITAKAYTLRSLRGFTPKVSKGRVTTDTASTTVSGGATKFISQSLSSGSWNLYRANDLTWIGKVLSVQSEISLTLTANAGVAMADQQYIAIRSDWATADKSIDLTGSVNKVGWLNAIYAERQWYANNGASFDKTYRLWFSDTLDPECVDLSSDGDWIPISSTSDIPEPIRGIAPTYNALLVFKENETFGVFGNSPSSFSARKLEDDGTLSTMSIQQWGAGAVWAGKNGIYFFDGITVNNLTKDKLGDVWNNSIRDVDPLRYRMWSMVSRNHYFLFLEKVEPTVSVRRGLSALTPTHWVICINLETKALSIMTNLGIRGAVSIPATRGQGEWFVANDANVGIVCEANALFDEEGVDTFVSASAGAPLLPSSSTYPSATLYPGFISGVGGGPDFYYESKKFNVGDDVRLKRFKQIAIHYMAQGGALKIDTVLGLNDLGKPLTSSFPASILTWSALNAIASTWDGVVSQFGTWSDLIQGVFQPKRVRFLKKSHHMSFRLYQEHDDMIRVRIGPFHIGYKLMREGRV